MSDKKIIGTPFTPANAPRQGGKPGRHVKVNKSAWQLIEGVLVDYQVHGKGVITALRLEKPEAYAKLSLAATEIALKYTEQGQQGGALVNISINRFFPDKEPAVTIDGANDDQSAS
jgi:hypothetical protein